MTGVVAFLFVLVVPAHAHAGFFSFLERFLKDTSVAETVSYGVHDAPVLSAEPSLGLPAGGVGGAPVQWAGDSSLLPVMGPLGSADIEPYHFDQITTYTVREGDTLSKIAEMFEISVDTIRWANDIGRTDLVRVGDVLVILPVNGIQHTVKKGETLKGIAKQYKADADDIAIYNGLDLDESLGVGVTIVIPDAEPALSPLAQPSSPRRSSAGGQDLGGYFLRPIAWGRKTQGIHGFNGVDLADSCGTPVVASAAGDVLVAKTSGWNGGYGKYIVIAHPNGTQTLYAHLASIFVGPGWHVARGFQIGTIGSTGRSTGCHVHFEVRGAKNLF